MLGNNGGVYTNAPNSPLPVGQNPISIVTADFNGDGIPDLAVANNSNSNVTVLLGTGNGGFTAAPGSPFAVGNDLRAVVAGDFNGDGIPDLATANFNGNNVTVPSSGRCARAVLPPRAWKSVYCRN